MSERFVTKQMALSMFFESPTANVVSGHIGALIDARMATGRDPETGTYPSRTATAGRPANFLGVLGYLALIDQTGDCFAPTTPTRQPPAGVNSFKKALHYFTTLSPQEINTIYALRCAFAHDYSLWSKDRPPYYYFAVAANETSPLVTPAATQWDGDVRHNSGEYQTTVNVKLLADQVEQMAQNLKDLAQRNELEIVLTDGPDELVQRYLVLHR